MIQGARGGRGMRGARGKNARGAARSTTNSRGGSLYSDRQVVSSQQSNGSQVSSRSLQSIQKNKRMLNLLVKVCKKKKIYENFKICIFYSTPTVLLENHLIYSTLSDYKNR